MLHVLNSQLLEMSWGMTTVFVYQKITGSPADDSEDSLMVFIVWIQIRCVDVDAMLWGLWLLWACTLFEVPTITNWSTLTYCCSLIHTPALDLTFPQNTHTVHVSESDLEDS